MGDERFEIFAWRHGESEGEAKGTFGTGGEADAFCQGLSAFPLRMRPHFIKVVHQPSGRTLSLTSDDWGGSNRAPQTEPDLTEVRVPDGFQATGAPPAT